MNRAGGAGEASSAEQPPPPPPPPPQVVQLVSSTWARDSHDLFDFEAAQLHRTVFTIQKSMKCVRSGTDVRMLGDHTEPPPGCDPLLRVVERNGSFWVDKASPAASMKKLWLVVRDLSARSYRLSEGDVIKLGRFKFRVRQLVTSACEHTQPELRLDETGVSCNADGNVAPTTCCRICLLEGNGEGDPLIAPCSCRGSIEYVHLRCLRLWIRGRLNLSDNNTGSYFYRPLCCELCKAVYPTYISMENEQSPLVEVPKTQPPFIVLENMMRDSQQHASRGLHVISLLEKILKLGRGHESDVRIADVSISRCHTTIRFDQGQFILEDNNSKFGTLVAIKKPRLLESQRPISIQVGRTVLSLSLQPSVEVGLTGVPDPWTQRLLHADDPDEECHMRPALMWRDGQHIRSEVDDEGAMAL